MQSTVPPSRPKHRNFMRSFLYRFTNTKDSATQKLDDLLKSSALRPSPPIISPSPKAVSPAKVPKFFAGVTHANGKDDSAFANKSLSFV